ncbi:MAG: glycosyltransferase family 2 protein [candidate division KSB1 bacterium]|nr:glycosyltransferase family 2 protein [candidate division KSB1 bacterium]
MAPKVFVITLNWNGRQWLEDCLTSVLALDYPNFEVVMVDNGSTDDSVAFVRQRFPSVHVVENGSNLGYARGFNAGLEYAAERGTDYFLIMNNDTVIDQGALAALVETAQAYSKAGFVTGKVYFYDQPDTLQTVGKKEDPIVWNGDHIGWLEKDVGQYETVTERAFLDDVMTLVDRRLYDEIGGYDPQFFLQAEEFDWQARAKQRGWKFYYTPKAKIWHRVSMSMGGAGSPIGRYFDTRSRMVVMARYLGLLRFLRYYFHTLFQVTNSLLRGLMQMDWNKIKPRLAMWLGFWAGTLWLIHRRPAKGIPSAIRRLA